LAKRIGKKQILNVLEKKFKKVLKLSNKTLPPILEDEIINEHILKGKSPVDKKGRFDNYSPSYTKAIRSKAKRFKGKRVRPVNLKLTGDMVKSFFIKVKRNKYIIGFKDKKAIYHDREGAGKSKVKRRMLPSNGEQFTSRIRRKIKKNFENIIKRLS
jgi:hypothetical protein